MCFCIVPCLSVNYIVFFYTTAGMCVCVCLSVCVCECVCVTYSHTNLKNKSHTNLKNKELIVTVQNFVGGVSAGTRKRVISIFQLITRRTGSDVEEKVKVFCL